MDSYNQARKNIDYGVSTDIYGNKTQHYKDGSTYKVKQRGSNILTGGNK